MVGTTKPPPKRPRNGWFLNIVQIGDSGAAEINIQFKSSNGKIAPYSGSRSNSSVKFPWGSVVNCDYKVIREGQDAMGEFQFTNKRGEVAKLREYNLNSFDGGVNSFSKRVTSMVVDKRQYLLAKYLSLLPCSASFVHHQEEVYSEEGFSIDGSGMTENDLKKLGGCAEELKDFIRTAIESAKVVDVPEKSSDDISRFFLKRKADHGSSKTVKKSKAATVDEREIHELNDEDGLEKEYQKSFAGMAQIPLDNIKISEDLRSKLCKFRIFSIKESMRTKYDPSLSIPVVCPDGDHDVIDLKNVKDKKFSVVQKIHSIWGIYEAHKSQ